MLIDDLMARKVLHNAILQPHVDFPVMRVTPARYAALGTVVGDVRSGAGVARNSYNVGKLQ